MKIKAIAPWFGGKRRLARQLVELFGDHKVYWEPFCGSMAVLMTKPPCEMETVNDLHGDLINLAMVIQDEDICFRLFERLSRTLYVESFFFQARDRWLARPDWDGVPDIERAYDYFLVSWLGINGVSGTERYNYQFAMLWCRGGGHGARRWSSVIESIPAWHKRLRNVVIIQRDGIEIINNIKDEGDTIIYCDPPYFEKSDKYLHDFTEQQHIELAAALKRFKKARVFVTYYEDPRLYELYLGWYIMKVDGSRQLLRNVTRGKKKKPRKVQTEILISNFPLDQGLFNE